LTHNVILALVYRGQPIPTQYRPTLQGDPLIALTLALLTAGPAGLMFRNTRSIAIACMAALVLLHPLAFLLFLVVGGVGLYFIHFR